MSQLDENNNSDDLLLAAKEHFEEGQYAQTESLLNQLILRNNKTPDVFFMLGTVYYNKGKFNKAIRAFKRALELDPSFTDASVGLHLPPSLGEPWVSTHGTRLVFRRETGVGQGLGSGLLTLGGNFVG